MSKRYDIEKITDIFQIPDKSFDRFLVDLKAYYKFGKSIPDLINEISAAGGVKTKTVPQKMVWVDDGKHDATIIINPLTKY